MNRTAYIERLVPATVRSGASYPVPNSEGMIKLDAMENPYPWPSDLQAEFATALSQCALNRYPDPKGAAIREPLATWLNLPSSLDLLFGNGSDEIIGLLISLLIGSGRSVCAPDPSFVMFRVVAEQYGVPFHALPLDDRFDVDLDGWRAELETKNPGVIFVPQPNNPTGNLFDPARLIQVIESTDALVVIDEAYTAFTDSDCLNWAAEYPNVVVMRTLSKVGLAGARFGLLIGAPDWIAEFDKIRLPYNINSLTQAAVKYALTHAEVLESQSQAIRSERVRLSALLGDRGFSVWPSEANFVVVDTSPVAYDARALFEGLKARGVLIKCLDGSHPRLKGTLRITVGQPSETDALMAALDQLLAGGR